MCIILKKNKWVNMLKKKENIFLVYFVNYRYNSKDDKS